MTYVLRFYIMPIDLHVRMCVCTCNKFLSWRQMATILVPLLEKGELNFALTEPYISHHLQHTRCLLQDDGREIEGGKRVRKPVTSHALSTHKKMRQDALYDEENTFLLKYRRLEGTSSPVSCFVLRSCKILSTRRATCRCTCACTNA